MAKVNNSGKLEEELNTLKVAYDNLIKVKDQEIKEVEKRLQEALSSGTDQTEVIQAFI